jgi:hypothetical protein
MFEALYNYAHFFGKYGYITLITICTIRSIGEGFIQWGKYISKREHISIGCELIDPTINICMDTAHLVYYLIIGAVSGFTISAFFPISLPIIMYMKK